MSNHFSLALCDIYSEKVPYFVSQVDLLGNNFGSNSEGGVINLLVENNIPLSSPLLEPLLGSENFPSNAKKYFDVYSVCIPYLSARSSLIAGTLVQFHSDQRGVPEVFDFCCPALQSPWTPLSLDEGHGEMTKTRLRLVSVCEVNTSTATSTGCLKISDDIPPIFHSIPINDYKNFSF